MKNPRFSLRFRIGLFYLLTALALLPLAYLLHRTSAEGASAQLEDAGSLARGACEELVSKYSHGIAESDFDREKFRNAILEIILEKYNGLEGGFWSPEEGFQGYAFPTYDGDGPKKDVPASEMRSIGELAKTALDSNQGQKNVRQGRREAVFTYACPSPELKTAAWILTRVPSSSGAEFDRLKWAAVSLLVIIGLTGIGSTWLLLRWTADLKKLQASIQTHSVEELPELPVSREPDLQIIVDAFNHLNQRLKASREASAELARRLGHTDRLALLGKMAAGIAHEIRNPLATVRLKLENAELQPEERLPKALPVVFEQMSRIDRLVEMLLAISRPFQLNPEEVEIRSWFDRSCAAAQVMASRKNVTIELSSEVDTWRFDAFHLARALENLLENAVAFSPPGTTVHVSVKKEGLKLQIDVIDEGPGIGDDQRENLFQPFISKRENGHGLGLILAKEVLEAHGGTLTERGDGKGAHFRLETPWLAS